MSGNKNNLNSIDSQSTPKIRMSFTDSFEFYGFFGPLVKGMQLVEQKIFN